MPLSNTGLQPLEPLADDPLGAVSDPLGGDPLGGDPLFGIADIESAFAPVQQPFASGQYHPQVKSEGLGKGLVIAMVAGGAAILLLVCAIIVIEFSKGRSAKVADLDVQSPDSPDAFDQLDSLSPVVPDTNLPGSNSSTFEQPEPVVRPGIKLTPRSKLPEEKEEEAETKSDLDELPDQPLLLSEGLERWYSQSAETLRGARPVKDDDPTVLHYSWLIQLLPHLGRQELYGKFKFDRPWHQGANLVLSHTVIPQFLNPEDSRQTWKGYPYNGMGLTHFVGMSGIEDERNVVAAKLPRSDPRAGIFGYGEVTRREDITDGSSHTLMILGSGELSAPWVQGGGATIRGARDPYFDSITGFGSRGGDRQGVIVTFADGSTHYLSDDIDPALFRAMCTTHAAETIDLSLLQRSLTEMPYGQ